MSRRKSHEESELQSLNGVRELPELSQDEVHLTHRQGNEDALELGIIDSEDPSNKYNYENEDVPFSTETILPDTPDMMDPTGKASITGSVLRQNQPLFLNGDTYLPPDPSISTPDQEVDDTYITTELSIRDRALTVEEDVNFHNVVSADIDLLWANGAPLKDILLHLYNSENTKNKIFKLEASKYYFSILTSECSYTDIISDDMYTLDYFLSQPASWFKCYMPKNMYEGKSMREEFSDADSAGTTVLCPDKMVISSSYNLLSKFQVHNKYSVPLDGLWLTFKDTLYSMGYFMERWYYEISVATNTESDSNVYERIDEINHEFLSKAGAYEIHSLVLFFNNNSTFIDTTPKSNLGRLYEAYEMLTLIPSFSNEN